MTRWEGEEKTLNITNVLLSAGYFLILYFLCLITLKPPGSMIRSHDLFKALKQTKEEVTQYLLDVDRSHKTGDMIVFIWQYKSLNLSIKVGWDGQARHFYIFFSFTKSWISWHRIFGPKMLRLKWRKKSDQNMGTVNVFYVADYIKAKVFKNIQYRLRPVKAK